MHSWKKIMLDKVCGPWITDLVLGYFVSEEVVVLQGSLLCPTSSRFLSRVIGILVLVSSVKTSKTQIFALNMDYFFEKLLLNVLSMTSLKNDIVGSLFQFYSCNRNNKLRCEQNHSSF